MSIAENHGGLYKNLKDLRDSNGQCECNFFKAMGLDYMYVNDGNHVEALIEAFSKVDVYKRQILILYFLTKIFFTASARAFAILSFTSILPSGEAYPLITTLVSGCFFI